MKRIWLLLLLIIFVVDQLIIGLELGNHLRFFSKPFLLPILIIYYTLRANPKNWLFIAGLVMSFFGDLFLMYSWGFIAGLSSFLIAHILYILTFKPYFQNKNLAAIPFITLFVSTLYGFLYPHLGVIKIPVLLYAVTIVSMLYVALGTQSKWIIIGALLFVISDSILALHIFYKNSIIGGMSVMTTYVLAQYCLVQGMIIRNNKK